MMVIGLETARQEIGRINAIVAGSEAILKEIATAVQGGVVSFSQHQLVSSILLKCIWMHRAL